jgi:hypothetical protein
MHPAGRRLDSREVRKVKGGTDWQSVLQPDGLPICPTFSLTEMLSGQGQRSFPLPVVGNKKLTSVL